MPVSLPDSCFSYCFPKSIVQLTQTDCGKVRFFLFTPDPPSLSGYGPRKSLCPVSLESRPQPHIYQPIPRGGLRMKETLGDEGRCL